MKVLSLFDGMSCGQIALRELGVPIERYYASEIDKHAIQQTQLNFPETIQLGDVEKWREWNIEWSEIDLLLAGSPCQGFSLAGKMLGHDDPRSRLYWVFLDILHHVQKLNPNVKYLLENVRMRPADEARINESLGIRPVVINSALVSAQNRVRLYWSNGKTRIDGLLGDSVTDIDQPADKCVTIHDILQRKTDDKYTLGVYREGRGYVKSKNKKVKAGTLSTKDNVIAVLPANTPISVGIIQGFTDPRAYRPMTGYKAPSLCARARQDGSGQPCLLEEGVLLRLLTPTECARLQTIPDWYKWGCSDTQAYKMLGNGWTVEVVKHILSHIIK
jgi:DNA (cytosine-5)-methyltransferase 3A